MARTAIPGGCKLVNASSTAADTNGFGTVTILAVATAASASVTVQVGDTSTVDTSPTTTLIDSTTGKAPTLTGLASGATVVASYIGDKRYIKASGTNATVYVLLGEARMTGPQ